MDPSIRSIHIGVVLGFLMIGCLPAMADDELEDPDVDYLPPDTFFGGVGVFVSKMFSFGPPGHSTDYVDAKRRLYRTVRDDETLYCACATKPDERKFDSTSCGYVPVNDNKRARRLEAEHVLPASLIARYRVGESCWVKHESCGSGRDCCIKNDPAFLTAYTDLVNLYPTIGELNRVRSNFAFDLVDGEVREFGDCDFEVDGENALAEPRDDVRGDVARIYFYMEDTYNLVYPDEWSDLLLEWDAQDPISATEVARNERIHAAQGSSNELVSVVDDESE